MIPSTKHFELTASAFDWKISDQKTIRAWGFNNTVPGPVLKANKGDEVIVTVKNELHEPTVIHWHGIRLPSAMDGTDDVQKPIAPGESFEYRFVVPDAGTFWYHSHQNETEQMERGMYGALIVEEETGLVTDAERVLMIDDMKLNRNLEFIKGGRLARWIERHDGREGEISLINGREDIVMEMKAGQTERWRFINASSARYVRLSLQGRSFRIIGEDGGLIEKPIEVSEVMIVPGERVEILAGPFSEGEKFAMESLPYNRMTFLKAKKRILANVHVGNAERSVASIPNSLREIKSLADHGTLVGRRITMSVGPSWKRGIDFFVNNQLHAGDKPVIAGELQVWEISNTSLMDHPFHLHGFFFQVLEIDGGRPQYISWKDTLNIKPRSRAKIAWMPDNRPGRWMYHCHILEHHEAGMMAHFEVIDPGKPHAARVHHKHQHTHAKHGV